jgi:hypothetical protein
MIKPPFVYLTSPRRWLTLLALGAAALLAVVAPTKASATAYYYGCGSLAPNVWCVYNLAHNYATNEAWENYSGSVHICVRLNRASDNSNYGSACGYDDVLLKVSQCNCGGLLPGFEQLASGSREIHGVATVP